MEEKKTSAKSSSNQPAELEGTSSAAKSSTASSSAKRQLPQDDYNEGLNNILSTERTNTEGTVLMESTKPSTSSALCNELHPVYTFGDQASRMVNAPVTGNVNFGDTHNNSPNTQYFQDNRDNRGHIIAGGVFHNSTFNQQIFHGAPIPGQAPSTSASVSSQPSGEDWQEKLVTFHWRYEKIRVIRKQQKIMQSC
uniref:Uncharacterized protein n=1 Tax=Plectus sambesii TaxID=2011161 RepID=A0A914UTV0_9BILA